MLDARALHLVENVFLKRLAASIYIGGVLGALEEGARHLLVGFILYVAPVLLVLVNPDPNPFLLSRVRVHARVGVPPLITDYAAFPDIVTPLSSGSVHNLGAVPAAAAHRFCFARALARLHELIVTEAEQISDRRDELLLFSVGGQQRVHDGLEHAIRVLVPRATVGETLEQLTRALQHRRGHLQPLVITRRLGQQAPDHRPVKQRMHDVAGPAQIALTASEDDRLDVPHQFSSVFLVRQRRCSVRLGGFERTLLGLELASQILTALDRRLRQGR